ncbi:MAG: glycosyltransferase family 39 protein [Proteobacteria bacterium]|nr:glycosyltransferase family 39 protein [Pseudomonadota bacterium]
MSVQDAAARRWFLGALAATLAFRAWLSVVVPFTGDEAYFLVWGQRPDIGYYDHPPMVGWLLALLAPLSTAEWVLRLPALLLPVALAFGTRAALGRWFGRGPAEADLAAVLVLLVPMNVWNVLVTTDTPLILFSFGAIVLFARAADRDSTPGFLLAGACLGLAFLSKYFAVLLGLGMIAWAIGRGGKGWKGVALVIAAALPAGLENLYWNYEACWSNVMFNAINRHEGSGLGWANPLLFVAAMAYLAAPLLWYAWRERVALRATLAATPGRRALVFAWLVPFAVFALLSPLKKIGLHWLLSFIPPLVLTLAIALPAEKLMRCVRFFAAFALLHVVAAAALWAVPLEAWKSNRLYSRLVLQFRTAEVVDKLAGFKGFEPATDNYTLSSILSYYAGRYFFVFGAGTSHARHDDIVTDVRAFDGKDILVVRRDPPPEQDYRPYFRSVEFRSIEVAGTTIHLVLGRGFDYAAYREGVLRLVRDRWYRIPAMLPVGACYFRARYFPAEPGAR